MEVKRRIEFANFGIRLGAWLIDLIIIVILLIIFVPKLIRLLDINIPNFFIVIISYFIGMPIIGILCRSFFESSKFQGTPGKIVMGIKVVDFNFEKITIKKSLIRNSIKLLSGWAFYMGYLVALSSEKKLTWHDKYAKTYVIKEISESFLIESKENTSAKNQAIPSP